jgi:hypothetical protein
MQHIYSLRRTHNQQMMLRAQCQLSKITIRRKHTIINYIRITDRQNYHSLITPAFPLIRLMTTCSNKKLSGSRIQKSPDLLIHWAYFLP